MPKQQLEFDFETVSSTKQNPPTELPPVRTVGTRPFSIDIDRKPVDRFWNR